MPGFMTRHQNHLLKRQVNLIRYNLWFKERKMLHVINAEIKDEYRIKVEFNNGKIGIIDFKKIFVEDHRGIVKELLDKKLFKTVKVNLNTLCWDNEVDFAPEYLYKQIEQMEEKIALSDGYSYLERKAT